MKRSSVLWLGGLLVLLGVVAVCEAHCGPNPPPPAVQQAPFVEPPGAPGVPPSQPPLPPTPPPVPQADSIDNLLNRLDNIEQQEAALKKAKEETVAKLKNKLEQLKQRLQKAATPPGSAVRTDGQALPASTQWMDGMGIGVRY